MAPQFEPMDREQTMIFCKCVLAEIDPSQAIEMAEDELPFLSQIVARRIKAYNLPIKFTIPALLAVNALADNPGKAVLILIDALTKYEGQTVSTQELAEIYPVGFYTPESFAAIVDNELKPRNRKWSELY